MIIIRLIAWAIGVVFVFIVFEKISYWYIWIPGSLAITLLGPYVHYVLTKAIIAELGFKGSKKGDDNKYITFFNVSFLNGTKNLIELKGIVDTDYKLNKDDILNILAATEKKKLKQGTDIINNGPALMSMMFDHEYQYEGETIKVTFIPLTELDYMIGNPYKDRG